PQSRQTEQSDPHAGDRQQQKQDIPDPGHDYSFIECFTIRQIQYPAQPAPASSAMATKNRMTPPMNRLRKNARTRGRTSRITISSLGASFWYVSFNPRTYPS